MAAVEEGLPVKAVMAYDAINIWGMCVLSDSFIQSWDDMIDANAKYGRKLTCALGDASWEMLVSPTLVAAGVDPAKDIEWVVAGEQRYIQVAEGNLDMLFSWPGEAWQLIGQNFDFIYIDGNDVLKTSSNPTTTSLKMIEEEPEVVAGYVRAYLKAMYFVHYNPEAAAAVICNQYPNIEVTWKAALFIQEGRNYQMFGPRGGPDEQKLVDNLGMHWDDKWELNIEAALAAGVISKPIPLSDLFTNEFIDHSWDRKKIEADADSYDIDSARSRYVPE